MAATRQSTGKLDFAANRIQRWALRTILSNEPVFALSEDRKTT
jgi:hypothetical protein